MILSALQEMPWTRVDVSFHVSFVVSIYMPVERTDGIFEEKLHCTHNRSAYGDGNYMTDSIINRV